eukprot:GHVU01149277.1.p2 GENE.GHVU01149277.1~~GHVU01149277.1.p2  ORF type:complete len:146 (+),score=7.15 GHVU01149277.1:200-637(+)
MFEHLALLHRFYSFTWYSLVFVPWYHIHWFVCSLLSAFLLSLLLLHIQSFSFASHMSFMSSPITPHHHQARTPPGERWPPALRASRRASSSAPSSTSQVGLLTDWLIDYAVYWRQDKQPCGSCAHWSGSPAAKCPLGSKRQRSAS